MRTSNDLAELAKALNLLQAEMPSVQMNTTNPFFGSRYADLGAVIETSKSIVAKNGFSISQFPTSKVENNIPYVGIVTILLHSSGQFLEDTIYLPILGESDDQPEDQNKKAKKKQVNYPQKAGITISYLRRYGWVSILGMYAEEDTDGNQDEENLEAIKKLRKEIKTIFDSSPLLQGTFETAIKELGYNNATVNIKLMEKVIIKLKEIQGEK